MQRSSRCTAANHQVDRQRAGAAGFAPQQRAHGANGRNQPAELPRIAETLAAQRGWSLAETATRTGANVQRVLPRLAGLAGLGALR